MNATRAAMSSKSFKQITADALTKCPECKKKKLRRLFGTGAAVMFKGSGFYETDYRSDSYKKAAKKDKEAAKKSNSSGDAKSESKSSDSKTSKPSKSNNSSSKD